jgi:hypothetical protein
MKPKRASEGAVLVFPSDPEVVVDRLLSIDQERGHRFVKTLVIVDHQTAATLASSVDAKRLMERLGAELASDSKRVEHWLSAHPSLNCFFVAPKDAAGHDTLKSDPLLEEFISFSVPRITLPLAGSTITEPRMLPWHCSRGVLDDLVAHSNPFDWSSTSPIRALTKTRRRVSWQSARVAEEEPVSPVSRPTVSMTSRVLAIMPHYECDEWLYLALASLTNQTRPPDAIVVVDDGSRSSPREVVEEFPEVTLLRTPIHVGHYRTTQQVIDDTDFDVYLHHDADDFSADDRLQLLLTDGEATGASMIGTQALQFHWDTGMCSVFCCPSLVPKPSRQGDYSVLHPTSLVTRKLVQTIGGYAALPFAGDTEFQHRARFTDASIRNIGWASYFKIIHPRALTMKPETGMQSPERVEIRERLFRRFAEFHECASGGGAPDLKPMKTAGPCRLIRECGPSLGPY